LRKFLFFILCLFSTDTAATTNAEILSELKQSIDTAPLRAIAKIKKELDDPANSNEVSVQLKILLAEGYTISGEFQKSFDIANNIIDDSVRFKLIEFENFGRFWLGTAKFNQGNYQAALQDYRTIAIFFEGQSSKVMHARSLMGIGNCYAQLGRYNDSLEYYHRALKLFQQSTNNKLISYLLNNIGSVYFWLKEYDSAINYYQQAIDTLININNTEAVGRYYANIGEAYTELKKYDLAEKAFVEALGFSKKNEASYSRVVIHLFLGKLKIKTNENSMAISYFDKVLVLATAVGSQSWHIEALLGKAKAYQQSDFSRAITLAREALSLSESINKRVFVKDSHRLLSDLYKQSVNYEQALFHNEKYNDEKQKLLEKDKKSELIKLSSRIEITQKEYQIELLEKDNALQKAMMKEQKIKQYIALTIVVSSVIVLFQWYRRKFHKKQSLYLRSQVEAQTKHIKSLSDIGREITSSLELSHITNIVYGHIKELFDADVFSIGLFDNDHQIIKFPITIEKDQQLNAFSMSMSDTDRPAVQCVSNCSEVLIGRLSNNLNDSHKYKTAIGLPMESVAYIPLFIESNIVGCITVQRQGSGGFDDYQLDMMRTIAAYTAIAIDHALTHETLKKASHTDFMTQLPNRRSFIEKAQYQLEICQRNKNPLSVGIADIDKFKLFNDTYGHDGGDFVLKEVAKLFKNELREQDLVARWGGEEFVFMLPNTNLEAAEKVLEKVRAALSKQSYVFNGSNLSVTSTFGVTQVNNSFNIEELIDIADVALYQGKESGRNKVVIKLDDSPPQKT